VRHQEIGDKQEREYLFHVERLAFSRLAGAILVPSRQQAMRQFSTAIVVLFAFQNAGAQSFVFFTFDPPGSVFTVVSGINNNGQIVGRHQDASGLHSFLRSGPIFLNIEAPGANTGGTAVNGINNLGQVVGSFLAGTATQGFLLAADGKTFTTFNAGGETNPRSINDRGEIAGTTSPIDGFLRRADGSVTPIRVPDASATRPSAINNNGEVAGTYVAGGVGGIARGFLRRVDGAYTTIEVPGIEGAQVTGLNNVGQITGHFGGHGFVRNTDGTFTTFDVLGARETYPAGINDSGQIAGYYYAIEGGYHGFLAMPVAGDSRPSIRSVRGVMTASGFGGSDAIAPGSWVEIYGQNLAAGARQWQASDFSRNTAPTSLDGVSVRVGGRPAFVSFISPGQINVQVPFSINPGQAQVIVTTPGGISTPYSINVRSIEPGLLEVRPSGSPVKYAVALLADNATLVLPPSPKVPAPARRARAGDTITLYGTGFGPVTPETPAGELTADLNNLQASFSIFFNGVPGSVFYAGLAPGTVGIYQFNVVVPAGILKPDQSADDQVALTFELSGVSGTQRLYTAIE
jgi:uncharacterized protein (TIGR03437 family)